MFFENDSYYRFVDIVSEGRKLDRATVRELADGRIYTGRQAKTVGLVDEFGSLQDAIDHAAELGGIHGTPRTVEYQPQRNFLPFMAAALNGNWIPAEVQALLSAEARGLWYLYTGP